jgi:hypothetical protein
LGVPFAALTVMAAQFMYISRLPILLNQVQAKIALPPGVSTGRANLKLAEGEVGQLPIQDWMTIQVLPRSKESEAWQLPPPWSAPPSIVMLYELPAVQVAVGAPAAVPKRVWYPLQGKLLPLPERGEVML